VDKHYQDFNIRQAIEAISSCLRKVNPTLHLTLVRWGCVLHCVCVCHKNLATLESVLLIAMENMRLCGTLLWPIIPRHAGTALIRLGFPRVPLPHQLTCLLTKERVTELEDASILMRQHNRSAKPLFDKLIMPELNHTWWTALAGLYTHKSIIILLVLCKCTFLLIMTFMCEKWWRYMKLFFVSLNVNTIFSFKYFDLFFLEFFIHLLEGLITQKQNVLWGICTGKQSTVTVELTLWGW